MTLLRTILPALPIVIVLPIEPPALIITDPNLARISTRVRPSTAVVSAYILMLFSLWSGSDTVESPITTDPVNVPGTPTLKKVTGFIPFCNVRDDATKSHGAKIGHCPTVRHEASINEPGLQLKFPPSLNVFVMFKFSNEIIKLTLRIEIR